MSPHNPLHVFVTFLRLGLTSFGGPAAHLGYFRTEFVERRRWLSDAEYADTVALCQVLPGPSSSQVGMALGLRRAGLPGMFAAWVGFTLPSAALMLLFALGLGTLAGGGWIAGLKLAAVAVVAHAVAGMARTLTPDAPRLALALLTAAAVLLVPVAWFMPLALVLAGAAGFLLPASPAAGEVLPGRFGARARRLGSLALLAFAALLALALTEALPGGAGELFGGFFAAGSLVFGGGHVVLPLLEAQTPWLSADAFLTGYAAAQALPGPLFAFAAYLGALHPNFSPLTGALLGTLAVFAPALLLMGVWPFWERWRQTPWLGRALTGVNAGVVGLLLAALYQPVFVSAVRTPQDFAVVLLLYAALGRTSAPVTVLLAAGIGLLFY